jgi:N-acetylglucosamine kinase-like BadF-type ATPase
MPTPASPDSHATPPAPLEAIVGIDGGGTKTEARAALLTAPSRGAGPADGTPPFRYLDGSVKVGATNLHSESREEVFHELRELRDGVLRLLPAGTPVAAVTVGAAGVDRPEEAGILESMLADLFPDARLLVVNDALTAMAGAIGHLGGVVVISGTGSIAVGAAGLGRVERAGGWGHLLGDEGGGYQIGLAALRAMVRSHDGRAEATAMTAPILARFALKSTTDLLGWLQLHGVAKTEIASVTPDVFAAARGGDAAARAICEANADELVTLATTARRKLPYPQGDSVPLATIGGNFRDDYYRGLFLARLGRSGADLHVIEPKAGPTEGGIQLAYGLLNTDPDGGEA